MSTTGHRPGSVVTLDDTNNTTNSASVELVEPLPRRVIKVSLITIAYATAFLSLVHLGIFLMSVPTFHPAILHTDVATWLIEKWTHGIWLDSSTMSLFSDLGLLLLFGLNHSSLASKRRLGSSIRRLGIHLDRALYVFTSGATLGLLVWHWQPVPIVLWRLPFLQGTPLYILHGTAWMLFYGTNLMLDLPDMVGFTQVVVSSPNAVIKSPELEEMLSSQRHMGLIPFSIILLGHPLMTLDRGLMTLATIIWCWNCWASEDGRGYRYASQMRGRRLYQ